MGLVNIDFPNQETITLPVDYERTQKKYVILVGDTIKTYPVEENVQVEHDESASTE